MHKRTQWLLGIAMIFSILLLILCGHKYYLSRESKVSALEKEKKETVQEKNTVEKVIPKNSFLNLIGKDIREVTEKLGQPIRIEPSYYHYDWWIYNQDLDNYLQIGVSHNKVVTLYANGKNVDVLPFTVGESYRNIKEKYHLNSRVSFEYEKGSYQFVLTEDDLKIQPLIPIGEAFVQAYIDKFTGKLSGLRMLDKETLIKQGPYELFYRGELIQSTINSRKQMDKIERANERQIFDITNILRIREGVKPLKWDEKIAKVAYLHSKDMFTSQVFSHDSKKYGKLADRLDNGEVFYQLAGENIAANYIDAPAVVEGWLNSFGHRESLLNGEFTHLGVGVYRKYYTQNFIEKWTQ
ncbi:CAP domain-containing protein [Cytobacillus sp. Hz8]|uniref:CAP domain-containing protein n=1 Tax=Cytobacillus sp. Hz8 TaxID=3347168 RepID=UPI0035DBC492